MTLSELAQGLRELGATLPTFASDVAATACIVGLTDLVNVTPVDTGQALSNWRVSLNEAQPEVIPAYSPSQRGKMVEGTWAHTIDPAITREANITPTLEAARVMLTEKRPGDVIHLQNWVPYIQRLNDGSSAQAPAGFIERANLVIENYVAQATR
jgi:hypothetical protein